MSLRAIVAVFVAGMTSTGVTVAADWIVAPSYFTHGPDGKRVQQYAPIGPFYVVNQQDYVRSGYRHSRSSLQFGGSVDHYHVVEEWGPPVRPYDEWRFPTRPYSVPYEAWGPPYAGLGNPFAFGAYPYRYPYPGQPLPPNGGIPGGGIPGGGVPGGGIPGGGFPGGGFPGGPGGFNPGKNWGPVMPYRGYQPWFDDRYPAFDDRAPYRREPFPVLPP